VVLAIGVVLGGGYLLAWAWRWPHADMRNSGASLLGTCAVLLGIATLVVALRVSRPRVMRGAAAVSAIAIVLCAVALVGVTDGQEDACGAAPACDSLIPGP
jgi:hypothetical protein